MASSSRVTRSSARAAVGVEARDDDQPRDAVIAVVDAADVGLDRPIVERLAGLLQRGLREERARRRRQRTADRPEQATVIPPVLGRLRLAPAIRRGAEARRDAADAGDAQFVGSIQQAIGQSVDQRDAAIAGEVDRIIPDDHVEWPGHAGGEVLLQGVEGRDAGRVLGQFGHRGEADVVLPERPVDGRRDHHEQRRRPDQARSPFEPTPDDAPGPRQGVATRDPAEPTAAGSPGADFVPGPRRPDGRGAE